MNLAELASVVADEAKAFEMIEKLRWPDGPICPHCGATDRIYVLSGVKDKKGRVRHGLKKCGHCRKQFTVRMGSIFEDSPLPLGKWILAIHLMCSSKKGISSNQLKRELGVSYQTAWFMTHRIRLAMTADPLRSLLGSGGGSVVEIDETFVGGKKRNNLHRNKTAAAGKKVAVMTLVDREGEARTVVVPDVKKRTLEAVAKPLVDKSATIVTARTPRLPGLRTAFPCSPRRGPLEALRPSSHPPHELRGVLPLSPEAWPDWNFPPRQPETPSQVLEGVRVSLEQPLRQRWRTHRAGYTSDRWKAFDLQATEGPWAWYVASAILGQRVSGKFVVAPHVDKIPGELLQLEPVPRTARLLSRVQPLLLAKSEGFLEIARLQELVL